MKMNAMFLRCSVVAVVLAFTAGTQAQQVTGELGSPHATTTTGGKQLPLPDPKFGGVIKTKASESTPVVGATRRAAQGRTQRAAHHDR
ncbi:MAG: hypothetical protein V9H26_22515 [Verrucomicrobiota bacterium]